MVRSKKPQIYCSVPLTINFQMSNKVNNADTATCKVEKPDGDCPFRMLYCWHGGIRLGVMKLQIMNQDEIVLHDFTVLDGSQGRGFGTKMLKHLSNYCRRRLFRRLTGFISSRDQVERLKSWYERSGFKVTESTRRGLPYDICYNFVYRSDRVPCWTRSNKRLVRNHLPREQNTTD